MLTEKSSGGDLSGEREVVSYFHWKQCIEGGFVNAKAQASRINTCNLCPKMRMGLL